VTGNFQLSKFGLLYIDHRVVVHHDQDGKFSFDSVTDWCITDQAGMVIQSYLDSSGCTDLLLSVFNLWDRSTHISISSCDGFTTYPQPLLSSPSISKSPTAAGQTSPFSRLYVGKCTLCSLLLVTGSLQHSSATYAFLFSATLRSTFFFICIVVNYVSELSTHDRNFQWSRIPGLYSSARTGGIAGSTPVLTLSSTSSHSSTEYPVINSVPSTSSNTLKVSSSAPPDSACLSKLPTTTYSEVSVSVPSSTALYLFPLFNFQVRLSLPCYSLWSVLPLSSNARIHRSLALVYPIEYIVGNKQYCGHRLRLCRRSHCHMLCSGHLRPTRSPQEISHLQPYEYPPLVEPH